MATIAIEKFLGLSELPLYQQPPGTCKGLTNFRVTRDGMLKGRGGLERLQPSGGTPTAPISGGFFTGAHEHNSPVAQIFTWDGGATYGTSNFALQAYYPYFAGTAVNQAIVFMAPNKFSRIDLLVGTAGTGAYTISWFYWNGAAFASLTGPTEDFKTLGARTVSFSPPSDWAPTSFGVRYGYAVYAQVKTNVITIMPRQKDQKIYVDWQGMKELYVASSNGASGTANGTIGRYGQSGTTAAWTNITTSGFSGTDPRVRFASWRGYMYWVNGIDQKRHNLDSTADVGFTSPAGALTTAVTAGTGLTGTFQYYITYGYGAAGELGESGYFAQTDAVRAPANQQVTITFSGLTGVPAAGTVDIIYLYRSVDLSTVTLSSSYGAYPAYRIATVTRDGTGAFPATYVDSVMAIPIPPKTMNPASVLPPTNCRHISVYRSRLFLGSNNQYPGRVWWSRNFEPESFDLVNNFADFTRETGGIITGMVEFADQIIVFTEDAMYGIQNVDLDPPNIYSIAAGIGCVAPDSIAFGFGYLCWLSRNGAWVWDGVNPPRHVSDQLVSSMTTLSLEKHGGSRGVVYDRMYEVTLIDSTNAVSGQRFRFDLVSLTWSTIVLATSDINLAALLSITSPFGHADYGVSHPLYGKVQAAGTLYHVFVGDYATTDDGNTYSSSAAVHLGPAANKVISPKKATAIVKGVSGAALTFTNVSYIGDSAILGPVFIDGSADYSAIMAQITSMVSYTGDIVVTYSVNGGLGTYLLSMYLDGQIMDQPMRTN